MSAPTLHGLEHGQRAALVINECQRGVIDPTLSVFPGLAEQAAQRQIAARTAVLAQAFRTAGLPVIHLHIAHRADFADSPANCRLFALTRKLGRLVEGTPDVEAVAELQPAPGDWVLPRSAGANAFNGSALDATLRRLRVQTLVLAGVSSNLALLALATSAVDLAYQVVLPEDCAAGVTLEQHQFMLQHSFPLLATVCTSQDILPLLV